MYYQTAAIVDHSGTEYTTSKPFPIAIHTPSTQTSVERPYWGCSSSASSTGTDEGTTGLWWSATYLDLLGKGAASSSSSFDHITAPDSTAMVHYYDVAVSFHTAATGQIYVQRWPVGSTTATLRQILSSAGGDYVLNKIYQFTIPISGGEEFTIGVTAAASSGQYSLFIEPSNGYKMHTPW